eukprot:7062202-Prymnesium_polylepis.3
MSPQNDRAKGEHDAHDAANDEADHQQEEPTVFCLGEDRREQIHAEDAGHHAAHAHRRADGRGDNVEAQQPVARCVLTERERLLGRGDRLHHGQHLGGDARHLVQDRVDHGLNLGSQTVRAAEHVCQVVHVAPRLDQLLHLDGDRLRGC